MQNAKQCSLGIVAAMIIVGLSCSYGFAGTTQDGKYYFNMMKASMIEVLKENQHLINTKPDGSVKNKKLSPTVFYKQSYDQFKKIGVGKKFSMKKMAGETDPAVIAPVLATLLQAGRITTAKSQKIINTESDGSIKLKKFIPAVFGKLTLEKFTAKTDAYMKQTTLGKGDYKARNPYNTPNEWETKGLKTIMAPGWETNKGYGEMAGNEYHYIKPIYIKKACLPCHGVPVGENGPYGHPKEGYDLNDIRGGIAVSLPVK